MMILFISLLFCSGDRGLAVVGDKPILESSVKEQVMAYQQSGQGVGDLDSLKKESDKLLEDFNKKYKDYLDSKE